MNFPEKLNLEILESVNPVYAELEEVYETISLLSGAPHLLQKEICEFIPHRPGEEQAVYKSRIAKFNFNSILSNAISSQVTKLSSGTLTISGLDQDQTFWQYFREHTDRSGKRNEKELLSQIFRTLLTYGKVYLHVDKPSSPIQPRNKAQEKQLGLNSYVNIYCPTQVINWSENDAGALSYIKVKQISQDTSNPLSKPLTVATWTFIDQQSIAKYSAYVKLNCDNKVIEILDSNGEPASNQDEVPLTSFIKHNAGTIPVIKHELVDTEWLCSQAWPKALEHLRLDMHRSDLETISYLQRTWNPIIKPDLDPSHSYVDTEEQAKSGPQYVMQGNFEWKEPRGNIFPHLQKSLANIKQEVEDIISGRSKSTSKQSLEQSGISKAFDLQDENEQIEAYGQILTQLYQQVLQLVAKSMNINGDQISVTGLTDFDIDTAESLITKLKLISEMDLQGLKDKLPPLVLRLMYLKLSEMLAGNLSAPEQQQLTVEIDKLLSQPFIMEA